MAIHFISGAGIFLDRILVTDTEVSIYQYVFVVNKWLDSEQVDGAIERVIPVQGYYDLSSMPEDLSSSSSQERKTSRSNRWQLQIRSGDDLKAGTTSNIYILGYGSLGHSERLLLEEAELHQPGKASTFEVDFGNIGDLFKLRLDLEDEKGSWQLGAIEMTDLNTGERIHLDCQKWLCSSPPAGVRLDSCQLFRELPVIRLGVEPLPCVSYSVRVHITDLADGTDMLSAPVYVSLVGEFGESGTVRGELKDNTPAAGKENTYEFAVEAVSLGRLLFLNVSVPASEYGEKISEGFRALQEVFDRHDVPFISARDWIVDRAVVRESDHAPYQFRFADSRVQSVVAAGMVRKQFALTDMEGLSTTKSSFNFFAPESGESIWTVTTVTGDQENAGTGCTPFLEIYGAGGSTGPMPLLGADKQNEPGAVCVYKVSGPYVGRVFKVRLRLDSQGENPSWFLKTLKLRNEDDGSELRFHADAWLDQSESTDSSIELAAIWPDIPPLPVVLYQVSIYTSEESDAQPQIGAFVHVFGKTGDTGKRRLIRTSDGAWATFAAGTVETFEFECVSLTEATKMVVGLDSFSSDSGWLISRIDVREVTGDTTTTFLCSSWLSETKGEGKTALTLLPNEQ